MKMMKVKVSRFSTIGRFPGVQDKNEVASQPEMLICIILFNLTTCE